MNLELKIYKNYKELCGVMDWTPTSGKSKQLQLNDLERYCTYHKEKNKFIIDEIFEEPLPKKDGRVNNKGGNNLIYAEYAEKLIIHMLSNCPIDSKTKTINMSRNGLYYKLHMINRNYNVGRNNINRFSRYLKVPVSCIYDFYNNTSGKLNRNIERTLNRLQGQCLIHWEYRVGVKLRTGANRLASDNEINQIIKAERKALKDLNEKSKKDIFLKGKWNEFNKKVCDEIQEVTPIEYYYKVFHINTTDDFRTMLLEAEDLETIQNELNATIYLSTIDTATNKYNNMQEKWRIHSLKKGTYFGKPKYENEQVQLRLQYINDTKKIANTVIDWDTYDLDLSEISNKKYTLMEALCDETGDDWGLLFLDDALDALF